MSLPATLPQAILDTILDRLALFVLTAAGNDMTAARATARQLLSDYNPETARELLLAAEAILLQLHSVDALCSAVAPGQTDNKRLRLLGCGISLSREQHKAHRKLDQLQKARRAANQPQAAKAAPANTRIEKEPTAASIKARAMLPTPQSFDQPEAIKRFAEILQEKQAEYAAKTAAIAAGGHPAGPNVSAAAL